jgi:hypothetical protein
MGNRNDEIRADARSGMSQREIALKHGVCKTTVNNVLRSDGAKSAPRKPAKARSFEEFRSRHDLSHIIKARVKELLAGDEWYDDADFRELCGVPVAQWRRYADSGEFSEHRVVKSNRINAWAPPKMARQMREVLDIHHG